MWPTTTGDKHRVLPPRTRATRGRLLSSLLFLPFLFVLLSPSAAPATERTGITGRVVDAATGAPVAYTEIATADGLYRVIADSAGVFRLRGVPVGAWEIRASRIGYAPAAVTDVVVKSGRLTPLRIALKAVVFEAAPIRVNADYFSKTIESRTSSTSLTYEEIRRAPGASEDVLRVVQTLAGIGSNDQSSEIIVRGGAPWENLFLIDNVEVPNLNHFPEEGGAGGAISMVNTEFVSDVEFSAGGFGVRYGDKLSSVLSVKLREGNRERFAGEADLNTAGAAGIVEGPIAGGRGSWMFTARRSYLELLLGAVGLTAVPRYFDVQGKAVFDLSRNHKLSAVLLGGVDAIDIVEEGDAYSQGASDVNYRGNQEVAGLTWRALFGSHMTAATTLSLASNYWDILAFDDEVRIWDQDSRETETTLKSEWVARPARRWELSWGGSLKEVDLDMNTTSDPESLITNDSIPYVYQLDVNQEMTAWKQAAYLSMRWDASEWFSVDGGVRYDRFDFTGRADVAPRASFTVTLDPATTLNGAWGDYYQTPPYYELTVDEANRRAKNYHAVHYVLGVEHRFAENVLGKAEFYYKDYDDYLVSASDTSTVLVSQGTGDVRGVDLTLHRKMKGKVWGYASYSLSKQRIRTPLDGETDGPYDYRQIASVLFGYRFSDRWEASVRWRYLGGLPYTPLAGRRFSEWTGQWEPVWEEPPYGSRYPAYHKLDFRVDRRTNFADANLVWYIDLQNLYGRRNVFEYRYNDDYTERQTVNQFGFLFVGGMAMEF